MTSLEEKIVSKMTYKVTHEGREVEVNGTELVTRFKNNGARALLLHGSPLAQALHFQIQNQAIPTGHKIVTLTLAHHAGVPKLLNSLDLQKDKLRAVALFESQHGFALAGITALETLTNAQARALIKKVENRQKKDESKITKKELEDIIAKIKKNIKTQKK